MYSSVDINPQSNIGWLESDFLSQIITSWEAEAGADNCTKVISLHCIIHPVTSLLFSID